MSGTIQSIQRAVAILRSFTEREPELGVNELSRRLDLHKSTVSRILTTLQAEGLVSQNPETAKYRLGVGLVSLAGVALGRLDVRAIAQPHLNALAELSEETLNVTIRDGNECVNIDRVASSKSIRYVGWIGRRMPLHCTAAGKVLLAGMTAAERQALLTLPLERYTDKTIVTLTALDESLECVRQQQFAVVHGEFEEGFSGIAAPIYDHTCSVAAVLSISGPTYRLGDDQAERYVQPLLKTAHEISREMGYRRLM